MDQFRLTRRQMLVGAAAAAFGGGYLESVLGPLKVSFRVLGPGRVAFDLNGERAWILDTALFAGHPNLSVAESPERLTIALTGARYPGTNVPADLTMELIPQPSAAEVAPNGNLAGALMNLRLSPGGFAAGAVPFAMWLAGKTAAKSTIALDGASLCAAGADCRLDAAGRAAAEFRPDWTLTLRRRGLALLDFRGQSLAGDAVTLALLPGQTSRLTVSRGNQPWSAAALLPGAAASVGELVAGKRLFDGATLEVTERGGTARLTFDGAGGSLAFRPAGGLAGPDGGPLAFPLAEARYTVTLGGGSTESKLTARLAPEKVWAQAGGAVLVMGATDQTPPFAWTVSEAEQVSVQFRPAFHTIAAESMQGLVVNVAAKAADSAVSLTGDGTGLAIALDRVEVVRPADLLALTFKFEGMQLQAGGDGTPVLVPVPGATPYMTVSFPSQHIAEEAVYDGIPAREDPAPPIASRAAGPSHLKFKVLAGQVPFTLADLLTWSPETFELQAGSGSQGSLLEVPYRLFMEVPATAAWRHSASPVADGKRTELWHTRIAEPLQVAYNTPESSASPKTGEFLTSLSPYNRWEIADRTQSRSKVDVPQLILSSLGAWMMARGSWTAAGGDPNPLEFWSHHMAMGRDIKVVVVEAGFLMPFGHRASLITISERRFRRGRAYLRQQKFIVVRQPVRAYDRDGIRDIPLNQVELKTLVTPPIDLGSWNEDPFWVKVGGIKYPFHVAGTDVQGRPCEFVMPMAFVTTAQEANAPTWYASQAAAVRLTPLQGQRIAYAPTPAAQPTLTAAAAGDAPQTTTKESQDTVLDTLELQFLMLTDTATMNQDSLDATFRAVMEKAKVRVPAVEQFAATGGAVEIAYHDIYKTHAFGADNPWEVFAKLLDAEKQLKLPDDMNGGVVMPSFNLRSLTRKFGPSGVDPVQEAGEKFKNGFDPTQYFSAFAKILGVIDLSKIIKGVENITQDVLNEIGGRGKTIVPSIKIEIENKHEEASEEPGKPPKDQTVSRSFKISLELDMTSALSPSGDGLKSSGPFVVHDDEAEDDVTAIKLSAFLQRDLGSRDIKGQKEKPNPIDFGISASMEKFGIALGSFLTINFDLIEFEVGTGGFDATIELSADAAFGLGGALNALTNLMGSLPSGMDSGDPGGDEEEEPDGVELGIEVPLENIPIGTVTIRSMKPWFYATLPLLGGPLKFKAGISERDDPFLITVQMAPYPVGLIGGGFFALKWTPDRITDVEMQMEMGVYAGFSIGPVRGTVSVRAGIYLHLALGEETNFDVTGFVRINGDVSIKIIDVSIELYLGITYYSDGDYWKGTARLSISVHVAFITISFSVTVEQRIANHSSSSAQALASGQAAPVTAAADRRRQKALAYSQAFCKSYA
jgi:hypothetical protein